jgi:hypothetical protein
MTTGERLPLYQQVTSNIGIVRMTSLQRWSDHTAAALDCTVTLYGSALTSKKWRDIDIALQWDMPTLNRGGAAWLWLCHAASVAASQEVGAPVEVHWHTDPMKADHLVLAKPKEADHA